MQRKSEVKNICNNGTKHIILLAGGKSYEREVSLKSAQAVQDALMKLPYKVTLIDVGADISQILYNTQKPDLIFNCMHGDLGENGSIQGMLNVMNIPYTHSGVMASALAMNKFAAKKIFAACSIEILPSIFVEKYETIQNIDFEGPYVVKPNDGGSALGVEIVQNKEDLLNKKLDFSYGRLVIEKYIKGIEINVPILDGDPLGVIEIRPKANIFSDYKSKYDKGSSEFIMPASIPQNSIEQIKRDTKLAYDALGCNGLAHVDFIFCKDSKKHYILELNTVPGMTPTSLAPQVAQFYHNISFKELIEKMIASAKYE